MGYGEYLRINGTRQANPAIHRTETITVGASPETLTFIWKTAPITLHLLDHLGQSLAGSRFILYDHAHNVGGVENHTTVYVPVSVDPGGPPIWTVGPTGYQVVMLPGMNGRRQVNPAMHRTESLPHLTVAGASHTFHWTTAPLDLTLNDQFGQPLTGSRFIVYNFQQNIGGVENQSSIRLPVSQDPAHPGIWTFGLTGYQVQVVPGMNGRRQINPGMSRFEDLPHLLAVGDSHTFAWRTASLTLELHDASGSPILGSQFRVDNGQQIVGAVQQGGSLTLPVTEDPTTSTIWQFDGPGYRVDTLPGVNGNLQSGWLSLLRRPGHLPASGLDADLVWQTSSCPLRVVEGSTEVPLLDASIQQTGFLGTMPSGSTVTLPVTDTVLYPTLLGTYADGYQDMRLQLEPGAPFSDPLTFRVLSDNEIQPAFVSVGGRSVGLRFDCDSPGTFLLGHWPLDDGRGTIASDTSGRDHDGTLQHGPSWTGLAQVGGALDLDGHDDAVQVDDTGPGWDFDLEGGFTLALWVRPEALDDHQILISKDDVYELELGHAADDQYSLRLDNLRQGAGSTPLVASRWQHLAVTWDGTTVQYYYDGQPDGSFPFSGTLPQNNRALSFGARAGHSGLGPVFGLHGTLDEIYIYGRALTPLELLDVYLANGRPTPPDVTPPRRFSGLPMEILPAGTANATLSLQTSEAATCRFSSDPGVHYASMPSTFSTTGGTAHSSVLSGLVDDSIYTIYARCRDLAGNTNLDDVRIVFGVSSSHDLSRGLMAHLPMDDAMGCQAADVSGSTAHGLLEPSCPTDGPQWDTGFLDGGLRFDDGSKTVRIPQSALISSLGQVTVTAWIRRPASTQFRAIVDQRNAHTNGLDLYVDGHSRAFLRINHHVLSGHTLVADGEWHHVVGVYDGSRLRLYVDGLMDAEATVGSTVLAPSSDLFIGRHWSGPDFSFDGWIDEVRLYDRALSDVEVLEAFLWDGI